MQYSRSSQALLPHSSAEWLPMHNTRLSPSLSSSSWCFLFFFWTRHAGTRSQGVVNICIRHHGAISEQEPCRPSTCDVRGIRVTNKFNVYARFPLCERERWEMCESV